MTKKKANPLSPQESGRRGGLATARSPRRYTPFQRGHSIQCNNRYVFTREDCIAGGKKSKRGSMKEVREKLFNRMRRK